jgi:predicted metal-dependent HD superfamily phosphohydrolase
LDFCPGKRAVDEYERVLRAERGWIWRMFFQQCKSKTFATHVIFE